MVRTVLSSWTVWRAGRRFCRRLSPVCGSRRRVMMGCRCSLRSLGWVAGGPGGRALGGAEEAGTVGGVRRRGLAEAVSFLSGNVHRSMAQRVVEVFKGQGQGRAIEVVARLPESLPVGTWVWFTGDTRSGAVKVLSRGYRVLRGGEDQTVDRVELGALAGEPHTFVLGRPAEVGGS